MEQSIKTVKQISSRVYYRWLLIYRVLVKKKDLGSGCTSWRIREKPTDNPESFDRISFESMTVKKVGSKRRGCTDILKKYIN